MVRVEHKHPSHAMQRYARTSDLQLGHELSLNLEYRFHTRKCALFALYLEGGRGLDTLTGLCPIGPFPNHFIAIHFHDFVY